MEMNPILPSAPDPPTNPEEDLEDEGISMTPVPPVEHNRAMMLPRDTTKEIVALFLLWFLCVLLLIIYLIMELSKKMSAMD